MTATSSAPQAGAGPLGASSADAGSRFSFIDVLRLVAASAVMIQHVFEESSLPALRLIVDLSPGVFGVVLFFLVSGFVMPLSTRGRLDPWSFFMRRVFRIYPALLTAFALWAVVQFAVPGGSTIIHTATIKDWLANLLLVHDLVGAPSFLGVTWTLIIEFAWYGLFAASIILLKGRAADVLVLAAPAVILTTSAASLLVEHRAPVGRIGMIYAAIIGFRAFQRLQGDISARRLGVDVAVFLATMGLANVVAFGYFHHPNLRFDQSFFPWILAPALFLLTQIGAVRTSRLFTSRILAWLGAISLSIYLLHPIAMMLTISPTGEIARILTTVLLTFVLSLIVYYAVERPGIALGRRLSVRPPLWAVRSRKPA